MSEISSQPEVKEVTTIASGGTILAASLAYLVLRTLSAAAQQIYKEYSAQPLVADMNDRHTIRPVSAILKGQRRYPESDERMKKLMSGETTKLSALLDISAAGYHMNNTASASIKRKLEALGIAKTPSMIQQAHHELEQALAQGHQKIFTSTLASACARAATRIGFNNIQLTQGPFGMTRVIAQDSGGRALVTEISGGLNKENTMQTEIVGSFGKGCSAILDRFEKELEKEGVKAAPPQRRSTGGICELATAKEFVRAEVPHGPPAQTFKTADPPTRSNDTSRRTARLINQTLKQRGRQ